MKYGWSLVLVVMASLLMAPVALAESPRDPHHMAKEDAHRAMEALMHLAKNPHMLHKLSAEKTMYLLKGVNHLAKLSYAQQDKLFRMQVKLTLHMMDLQVKQLYRMASHGPYSMGLGRHHMGGHHDRGAHGDRDHRGDRGRGEGHDGHDNDEYDEDDYDDHDDADEHGDHHESDHHGDGDDHAMHDGDKHHKGHMGYGYGHYGYGYYGYYGYGYGYDPYYDYRYDMVKYYSKYYHHYSYDYYKYHKKHYGGYHDYEYSYDYEYGKYHTFPKMWVHKGKSYKMSYHMDLDVHKTLHKSAYACHAAQMSATRYHAWDRNVFVGPCQQVGDYKWTFNVWMV